MRRVLEVVERTPRIGGAIYWTLREFAVKPDWDGGAKRSGVERDGIHNKGLITYEGERKPAWEVFTRNARATTLWRGSGDVAAATGVREPVGRGGWTDALPWAAAIGGLLLLLAVPVWAFSGLMRAGRRDDGLEATSARAGRCAAPPSGASRCPSGPAGGASTRVPGRGCGARGTRARSRRGR